MSFDVHMMGSLVPESYSRQLDERVAMTEKPYGYVTPPPAADTGDFDMQSRESHKEYKSRDRRG